MFVIPLFSQKAMRPDWISELCFWIMELDSWPSGDLFDKAVMMSKNPNRPKDREDRCLIGGNCNSEGKDLYITHSRKKGFRDN